jgi:hypothetical protein
MIQSIKIQIRLAWFLQAFTGLTLTELGLLKKTHRQLSLEESVSCLKIIGQNAKQPRRLSGVL